MEIAKISSFFLKGSDLPGAACPNPALTRLKKQL